MKNNPRSYSPLTVKRLYAYSGNQCAFPGCKEAFFNSDDETNLSVICHIEAASSGGQRYNPDSTDDYRSSFDNLILLCPNHHKETDNVTIYTVEVLRDMKREHEDKMRKLQSEQNILVKHPSALNKVISLLGRTIIEPQDTNEPENAPNTEHKISYNHVIRYKPFIQSYAAYQGKLNAIYGVIEKEGSSKKEIILKNINALYLREKGKYQTLDAVRANADNIIESIEKRLWEIVDHSSNEIDLDCEVINLSILIILVDAFMRCSILEEPPMP